ncbi:hypothetical protein Kisp01_33910 [Kineosporia sp. NBRC 101677]|nr:hypothetical protein Kisp01_33910 [Kineosporia sp. NBRC 101677]
MAAVGAGAVAALVIPDAEMGINIFAVALLIAGGVLLSVRPRPVTDVQSRLFSVALVVLAVLLSAVSVVRASEWLSFVCVLAAAALAAAAALGVRQWSTLLGTGPLMLEAVIRAVPWAGITLQRNTPRRLPVQAPVAVLTGVGVGVACAGVIGALLASADAKFASLLSSVGEWFRIEEPPTDLLVGRVVVLVLVTLFVLALGFAASSTLKQRSRVVKGRHPAEWMVPLVLVAATIAAFLAVEAGQLFGGSTVGHAARAREGFGQLIVVTVLVLLLIAWSGRSAGGKHRRLLGAGAGTLLALTLLLAVSALSRLWLYQDEYGWTVARLNAGAFELWVVVLLLAVGLTWLLRRTDWLPRLAIGSAGLGLLALAVAGPDALVATANVHRFEQGHDLDAYYLSQLSEDAVPALMELPKDVRPCVLSATTWDRPWYAWNLAHSRAQGLIEDQIVTAPACVSDVIPGSSGRG